MTSLLKKIFLQMTLNKNKARMILGEDDEDEDDDGSRKLVKYTGSTKNTEDTSEVLAKNDVFFDT